MKRFHVIGLDDCEKPSFSEEILSLISEKHIFSGGKRHYELVHSYLPTDALWIDITVPLEKVFAAYENHDEIVVFASGDPLFFGFVATIRKYIPDAVITVLPVFNSLQMLAHRLVIPYQDWRIVSLTGRSWHEFDRALIEQTSKIGVLTDRVHTPAAIAARMLEYGYDNYRIHVGEHLGNKEIEKVGSYTLEEASVMDFTFPNCLLLEEISINRIRYFGIPEDKFELLNGRTRMITKMPIRLLSLQMLHLRECTRLWDIGFCTGSVSIEAKLQFPHLHVTAFEVREEGRDLMKINSHRFGTPGIETIIGDFCDADLTSLPAPDAVFIGGHGGKLIEIVQKIESRLLPNGAIVFNSVSEDSHSLFKEAVERAAMKIEKEILICLDSFNPITVCRAVRVKE